MTKSDDYLWDRSGEADPEVARLEQLLAPLRHDAPLDELRLRRRRSRLPLLIGIVTAVAAVLALVVWWRWPGGSGAQVACAGTTGFKVTAMGGKVACGDAAVERGELPINTVLDTGANRAELAYQSPVAPDIRASIKLGENTRVRLDHTSNDRHQFFLETGRMHAWVSAPPRIFAVGTASAQVTDLGCEYELVVDPTGAGSIRVLTGKVELETGTGAIVVVPRGAHARLLPGRRAGVPLTDTASHELTVAVHEFEAKIDGALQRILKHATDGDALTLANLVLLVPPQDKRAVLEHLADLVPPPQGLEIDEALGDPIMFEMWFDEVVLVHIGASMVPQKKP